ncbi:MAG: ATP-binding protein [Anaerolineales bacterium]|jgi:signal transduction histidine kinase
MMNDDTLSRKAINKAFPGIPEKEIIRLIKVGNVAHYPIGTNLCMEGQTEDVFYVLLEGEVEVTKEINQNDVRILKHLKPGDFFGEMGLIHDAPRAATVTTTKYTTVLEIDKEGFEEVLHLSSVVSLSMVREVSRRLRENDEMAIEDLRLKAGELAEAYQQLAELDLARREFLTTIAHELRTPLTSASGYMHVIQMGMLEGEALQQAIATVTRNLEQIVSLINDILFLQEMELILSDFESVDMRELIARVIEAERGHAEEMGIRLQLSISPTLPTIPGDIRSLERAFLAIVNNAIKFSIYRKDVQVTVDHNSVYIWVEVMDQGIGIPQSDRQFIFNRFWRTEEFDGHLFDGVGLGLPIAKQVIEQHGGEIEVKSEVEMGTTFIVRLKVNPLPTPII